MPPTPPAGPWHPYPQKRNLVVKSGTTTGEHDMSSACGAGCCFVTCTPTPSMSPGRGIWWPRVVLTEVLLTWAHVISSAVDCLVAKSDINWSPVDLSSCSFICSRMHCLLLSSVCNWPLSWVHPVYNIPSLCVKSTSSVNHLSQFLQYLPKYSPQSSSCFTTLKDQQSSLDMERWLAPLENFYIWKTFYPAGYYLGFQ